MTPTVMTLPRVLGHRGAPRAATENTLGSFRAAMAQGASGVELDVRLCGTGELVVCHDATLARLTGRKVSVTRSSLLALRGYDLGGGERVPTLADVFAALPPTALVNVEIKVDESTPDALACAVVAALAGARVDRGRVLVSSFDPAALCAMRARAPELRRGLLLPEHPLEAADVAARARDALPAAIHPHHAACTAARVARWRALGYEVNVWTVDAPEDVLRVARAGVTAIITNVPAQTAAVLAARAAPPP
jgi:glycerophosphoryl diester phosphodiesterase